MIVTNTEREIIRKELLKKGVLDMQLQDNGDGTWFVEVAGQVIEGDSATDALESVAAVVLGVFRGGEA